MGRFYQKASRSIEGEKKLFSVIKENHLTSIAPLERYLHLVWVQKSGSSKVNWVLVSWIHFFPFSCYLLCEHPGCVRARADIQIHTLSFLCGVRLCLPLRSKKKNMQCFFKWPSCVFHWLGWRMLTADEVLDDISEIARLVLSWWDENYPAAAFKMISPRAKILAGSKMSAHF